MVWFLASLCVVAAYFAGQYRALRWVRVELKRSIEQPIEYKRYEYRGDEDGE